MPVSMTSPQDKIVSLKVVGRTFARSGGFSSADIRRELGDDFRGQLALYGEDVGNLPVEAARPKGARPISRRSLRRDAKPVPLARALAFHHVGNAQLYPELAHIAFSCPRTAYVESRG